MKRNAREASRRAAFGKKLGSAVHANDSAFAREPLEITANCRGRSVQFPLELAEADESVLTDQAKDGSFPLGGVHSHTAGVSHDVQTIPAPTPTRLRSCALRNR